MGTLTVVLLHRVPANHRLNASAFGETMPFYRAYDHAGYHLAQTLEISDTGAKELMKTVSREVDGLDLYAHGKEAEKKYHTPVREAERAAHQASRTQTRTRTRSRG